MCGFVAAKFPYLELLVLLYDRAGFWQYFFETTSLPFLACLYCLLPLIGPGPAIGLLALCSSKACCSRRPLGRSASASVQEQRVRNISGSYAMQIDLVWFGMKYPDFHCGMCVFRFDFR